MRNRIARAGRSGLEWGGEFSPFAAVTLLLWRPDALIFAPPAMPPRRRRSRDIARVPDLPPWRGGEGPPAPPDIDRVKEIGCNA